MIRGILYWSGGLLFTILIALCFYLLLPLYLVKSDLPHLVINFWAKVLVKVFYGAKLEVKGLENITEKQNYIIVSNHRSYTDILFAHAVLPLQFRWLAKSSLYKIPVIGLAMRIAGYVPVERTKYISASRSLQLIKDILNQGRSVWIFPEGTRTPKEELGKFKRGAFLLAKETKKPILPVILVNTDRIFERPYIIRRKTVNGIVLKPVYYSEFKTQGVSERTAMESLSQHLREKIQSHYNTHATKS